MADGVDRVRSTDRHFAFHNDVITTVTEHVTLIPFPIGQWNGLVHQGAVIIVLNDEGIKWVRTASKASHGDNFSSKSVNKRLNVGSEGKKTITEISENL